MRPFAVLRRVTATTVVLALAACTATDTPSSPTARAPRRDLAPAAVDPVVIAAGDIVCGTGTSGALCRHAQTAAIIGATAPDAVLLLGDNQYEDGTLSDYNAFYHPTWGAYKSITRPSPGNHEYNTPNASGYYDYFNGVGVQTGRAGDRSKGYYSYDLGAWHVVSLNSNCGSVGGCGAGSPQETWLRADLAAHPAACTLAYWHHPRFSSGVHGNNAVTQALWQALQDHGADLILTGHDHNYERFAPQTATGVANNTIGVRQFVVGTGGKELRTMGTTRANSQLRANNSLGVLKLVLRPTSYDWQFLPVPGHTLNDAGTAACNVPSTPNQAPTARMNAPANRATFAQGAAVSFAGTGTDPEDGALTGASLVWTSSRDGQIGTGTSFTKSNLTVGTHTISLRAFDSKGLASATVARDITITASSNQAPTASISSPAAGASFAQGAPVTFTGAGTDPESGALTGAALVWTSTIDGQIGTGPSFTTSTLSAGTHTVTLTARDPQGATGTATRAITVTPPTAPTGLLESNSAGAGCLLTTATPGSPSGTVSLAACAAGSPAQTWTVPAVGGTGTIVANGACLTAQGTTANSAIATAACAAGAPAQAWTRTAIGELRSAAGLCVSKSPTAPVLRACNGTNDAQRWTLR